jgi:hypothetical protein
MGEKRASESSSCRLVEPSRILSVSPASFGVLGRGIFVITCSLVCVQKPGIAYFCGQREYACLFCYMYLSDCRLR